MKKFYLKKISASKRNNLLTRKAISPITVKYTVEHICNNVKQNGLKAAVDYAYKIDGLTSKNIYVTQKEFDEAEKELSIEIKNAIKAAYKNIYKFHKLQYPKKYSVETVSGVKCERKFIPIENVGLYIPAGTAPLPSTMLMLGIPAQIAGCKRVVVASPAKDKINPAILYAAKLCGIKEFVKIGGAHGISLLAYGDKKFKKVDKIFGPGNQFVTAAKSFINADPEGCAIDMIAGPSELLIIADKFAKSDFVASDLLSQAEHGKDSVVVLLTTEEPLFDKVNLSLTGQLKKLPRKDFAQNALKNSFCLIVDSLNKAFEFSNDFAPEHLILNLKNSDKYLNKVVNAGSVFVGEFSPESAGDYASGTNHSLPTYGFARSSGGVSVDMFMKGVTFQFITKTGIKNLSKTIITLAETESLKAHAEAVRVRLK
ncbi:MAG: histidinol dehydrogenase [Ignavibacteriaceae bacterium]